jgi:mono/diheme cytochrome c family protein
MSNRFVRTSWIKGRGIGVIAALFAASLSLLPLLAHAAPPMQAQSLFDQKCKACHTIGGGRTVGPDLKGLTERRDRAWAVAFISTPDQVIKQGDPIATQLVKEYGMPMPNVGVSAKDAEALVDYIAQASGGAQGQAAQPAALVGNAAAGRELFTGSKAFENGGVQCISCHNVSGIGSLGGGNLAKDVTASFANLGEAGIDSSLRNTPFPGMKEAFAGHPLTDQEVADLTAFLREASGGQPQPFAAGGMFYPLIAVVVFLVFFGIINLAWSGRLRGVRQPLVKGGVK